MELFNRIWKAAKTFVKVAFYNTLSGESLDSTKIDVTADVLVELALQKLIEQYANPEFLDNIFSLVRLATVWQMDGDQKKQEIKRRLREMQDGAGNTARGLKDWVLDSMIQQAYTVLAIQSGKPAQRDA